MKNKSKLIRMAITVGGQQMQNYKNKNSEVLMENNREKQTDELMKLFAHSAGVFRGSLERIISNDYLFTDLKEKGFTENDAGELIKIMGKLHIVLRQ